MPTDHGLETGALSNQGNPDISTIFGRIGPAHPRLGKFVYTACRIYYRTKYAFQHIFDPDSRFARERIDSMRARLVRGETVYLAGLGVSGHNSGAALLEVTAKNSLAVQLYRSIGFRLAKTTYKTVEVEPPVNSIS